DLVARVVSWVTPDRNAVGGWRPLLVTDTDAHLPAGIWNQVSIPSNFPDWIIDLDDLDKSVPKGAVPASWQGQPAGKVLQAVDADGSLPPKVKEKMHDLGNYRKWTYDKLLNQLSNPETRAKLEKEYPQALALLTEIDNKLTDLAAMPSMNRRLRKLST